MGLKRSDILIAGVALAPLLALSTAAQAATVANPLCPNNTAFFDPSLPPSIDLPVGFKASVFASGLNAPTGIAFLGDSSSFQVYVLESGMGCLAYATTSRRSAAVTSTRTTRSHPTSRCTTKTGD